MLFLWSQITIDCKKKLRLTVLVTLHLTIISDPWVGTGTVRLPLAASSPTTWQNLVTPEEESTPTGWPYGRRIWEDMMKPTSTLQGMANTVEIAAMQPTCK